MARIGDGNMVNGWEKVGTDDGSFLFRKRRENGTFRFVELATLFDLEKQLCELDSSDPYVDLFDLEKTPKKKRKKKPKYLGDHVESMLSSVGVTKERVSKWVGDCGCDGRQERLNKLDEWARNAAKGVYKNAKKKLLRLLNVR